MSPLIASVLPSGALALGNLFSIPRAWLGLYRLCPRVTSAEVTLEGRSLPCCIIHVGLPERRILRNGISPK